MTLLTEIEVRVLGSLIEKEFTTPDYYPLSLNGLTTACNQLSNRYPVVHYEEDAVSNAADTLREKNLVHMVDRGDSRVKKYRHVMGETMTLRTSEIAALCVLMLRGQQTIGEIRTRSSRIYDFTSLEEVETILDGLIAREPRLIVRLPRQPGQKEVRYAHLLSGDVVVEAAPPEEDRVGKLEAATEELRREVDFLKQQFEQFRKQFE